ncbi:MAG: helix-turn-helix domain-containing protein [Roseivirga sp.]|nr:helix-turn-helix domain-containing protein [Roseivirga sp.]
MTRDMSGFPEYHLDSHDPARLHFALHPIEAYIKEHKDHVFNAHRNSFFQLIWFKKAGLHYVDYETVEHPANAIFFINTHQVHNYCEFAPNEGFVFHFNDFFIHRQEDNSDNWLRYRLFNEIGTPFVVPNSEELNAITQLTHCLLVELSQGEYNYEQQIYYLFRTILLKVERLKHVQYPEFPATDMHLKLVIQFKELVEQYVHKNRSIDEFASELGTSSKSLTGYTRKYLQQTPAVTIQKRKILEAKRLLSHKELSIQEVAYRLGFEQPTYFTKYFKKDTGMTPKDFVRLIS